MNKKFEVGDEVLWKTKGGIKAVVLATRISPYVRESLPTIYVDDSFDYIIQPCEEGGQIAVHVSAHELLPAR